MSEKCKQVFGFDFTVKSSNSKDIYMINIEKPNCTCMDFTVRNARNHDHICKHIRQVLKTIYNHNNNDNTNE